MLNFKESVMSINLNLLDVKFHATSLQRIVFTFDMHALNCTITEILLTAKCVLLKNVVKRNIKDTL